MWVVAFLLGFVIGGGIFAWRERLQRRHWHRLLTQVPADITEKSLSVQSQMRQALTHLSQVHQEAQEQLQMYERIIELAPIGYVQVDGENHPLIFNRQARSLLKVSDWHPGGDRLFLEVVRSYELDLLIQQTRYHQQSSYREWQFFPQAADAEEIISQNPQTLRAYGLPLPEGDVGVFLEDRQMLVELSQSRDRWMSDLAHELRTPLTSIQLVVETLVDRLDGPMKGWVERLLPETQRLVQLVQDWLELSHLENQETLTTEPLYLQGLIESVWQTLEPLAAQKQVNFRYREPETDTESFWVEGDSSRLYRVFLNLLDNAIRYSPAAGTIQVQAQRRADLNQGDRVQIEIVDEGEGFASADLPHIFERLYRGDPGRARSPDKGMTGEGMTSTGSGLGLAIVKQIILAHQGTIEASNHPQTGGACLTLDLPRATPSPREGSGP
ncbi:HAMP domain-containing histidine kinase [Geitlerinema sp. P-1104]|uniref:sensor histidine kinase n=1 Tax=Geitlerinema sp. P-1104 TaxID=2546230 RepID=UPI00147708B4|nr:HAMP domain-containing sensor histidine kinase [Geitlerinema sp. P-1104]NMG58341.1 HAMP domain-containing histidine kinase [Geitlerinema sp. P-1104]